MSDCCATKKLWLAEAELALHRLLTGTAEQTVQFGSGKSVTYTAANINQLKAYVDDLKNQVAACDGVERQRRGPVRFVF